MTDGLPRAVDDALSRGWHLVPVAPRSKRPLIRDSSAKASADPQQVAAWASGQEELNYAVALGPSGLAVVDIDSEHGEAELAGALLGDEVPVTPEARTSRGRHLYFRDPGGLTKSAAGGLDLQVGTALAIIPPSIHGDGAPYRWAEGRDPASVDVAMMPDALIAHFRQRGHRTNPGGTGHIPEGERNVALTGIAGSLRAKGDTEEQIATKLSAINQERCTPPLGEEEVASIATSISKYPAGDGSEADRLIAFARDAYRLAVDEQNEAIAIPRDGPRIVLPLGDDRRGLAAALRSRRRPHRARPHSEHHGRGGRHLGGLRPP